jgi:hypothetical protein
MFRYSLIAYYEDRTTEARVAQRIIVIAENDQAAIQVAKAQVTEDAVGGRVSSIKVLEKSAVTPGVVFRGDPYIPFQWHGMRQLPSLDGTSPGTGR